MNNRGKCKKILVPALFCVILMMPVGGRADALSRKNRRGNSLYEKEKYEDALKVYRDAQIESPESAPLHYNVGNTLYRKKKYDEAIKEYEKALYSEDPILQQQVYYNMGNCKYRAGDDMVKMGKQEGIDRMKKAIEAYKKALELNPKDNDSKFNIEFVQNKLKELAQNSPKDKNQQNQQQQQQQSQPGQQNQDQQQQQQKQQPQDQAGKDQDKKDEEDQPRPQPAEPKEGQMSEEDAKRILDALKNEDKDLQKKMRRMPGKRGRVIRDW